MLSIRLSDETEGKINELAKQNNISKSDIVKEALNDYLAKYENYDNPYELGKDLFGRYESGRNDLSVNYKKVLRDKFNEKNSYRRGPINSSF